MPVWVGEVAAVEVAAAAGRRWRWYGALVFYLIMMLPFPLNVIVIVALVDGVINLQQDEEAWLILNKVNGSIVPKQKDVKE
jgi:hypothetical protein